MLGAEFGAVLDQARAGDDTGFARLWRDPEGRTRLGDEALERAREQLGEERYYRGLMDVYGDG